MPLCFSYPLLVFFFFIPLFCFDAYLMSSIQFVSIENVFVLSTAFKLDVNVDVSRERERVMDGQQLLDPSARSYLVNIVFYFLSLSLSLSMYDVEKFNRKTSQEREREKKSQRPNDPRKMRSISMWWPAILRKRMVSNRQVNSTRVKSIFSSQTLSYSMWKASQRQSFLFLVTKWSWLGGKIYNFKLLPDGAPADPSIRHRWRHTTEVN